MSGESIKEQDDKIIDRIRRRSEEKRIKTAKYYVASRVKHADLWKDLRSRGAGISSSWIDEAEAGETESFSKLWSKIQNEISQSNGLVLLLEPDDFPLKGALVEVGMAIAYDKPVRIYAPDVVVEDVTFRPIGSWIKHPYVQFINSLEDYFGVKNNETEK